MGDANPLRGYSLWRMNRLRISSVILATLAGAILCPTAAQATPSSGITAVTLAQGAIPDVLKPFASGADNYVAREITIAPGGTTGWHFHDGRVLGFVKEGTLTHPGADCAPHIFNQGDFIDEPSGADKFHAGRNLSLIHI